VKALFAQIKHIFDLPKLREEVNKWILTMFLLSFVVAFCFFVTKKAFSTVAENITINIRTNLYKSILVKHIGWHDDQQNAAGILSSILAQEVQLLNGVSTEAFAVMAEALCAITMGLAIAFVFSWQVALVSLAMTPAMVIGGVIGAKLD
jgi:ATP-binding cassette, subfamily B (MDR/TAP), member 1